MTQTNYLQIDVGATKQARAYQRKKEKKNTEEHKQFQQEAAIYLRVSSEMQKEGFSIEAQKLACQRCVQEKGYHLSEDHIYIDEAFTAKNEDRPAFRKMMVDAYMKQFSLIVVHKMDRFERNAEASAKTSRELKAIGVKVFSAYENLELSDDLFCKILSALNEHYIANLSMETAKGKHQSARSGYSNCSRPPFGYRKWQHGDPPELDKRILIVDHPAAEAVKEIFELYATGMYSFMDLAQYLNDKGFTTCTGRAFGKETIRSMMENVVYVGCVVYNNSAEEKFEIYPGKHEAIIPIDLFKKVKEIRSQKIIAHNTAPVGDENIKKHCLVQNLVCCADCGQRLRVKRSSYSDNAYRYIDCATIRGLTCKNDGKSVLARKVDSLVSSFLNNIVLPQNWVSDIEKKVSKEDLIQKINNQIETIKSRMQRRTFAFINGKSIISETEFEREQSKDNAEIEELKRKLPKDSVALNAQITLTNSLIMLFNQATKAEQHEIVHYLFKNIYIDLENCILTGFEPNPDYEFLFSTLSERCGWAKVENIYYIERKKNEG